MKNTQRTTTLGAVIIVLLVAAILLMVPYTTSQASAGEAKITPDPTPTQPPPDLLIYLLPGQRVDILGSCDEFHHVTQQNGAMGGFVQCVMYGE